MGKPESIAKAATKYEGNEGTLNGALAKKYGVDLTTFKAPAADPAAATKSAEATVAAPAAPLVDRLTAFYAVHQPDKLEKPESIAKAATKYEGNEGMLNGALAKKYGVDLTTFKAPAAEPAAATKPAEATVAAPAAPLVDRLTAFYA